MQYLKSVQGWVIENKNSKQFPLKTKHISKHIKPSPFEHSTSINISIFPTENRPLPMSRVVRNELTVFKFKPCVTCQASIDII